MADNTAPVLPKPEQAEVAQNDPDSPVVTESDYDDVKLAADAKAGDDAFHADNPNVPLIRAGDPRVGGEHFL